MKILLMPWKKRSSIGNKGIKCRISEKKLQKPENIKRVISESFKISIFDTKTSILSNNIMAVKIHNNSLFK